VVAYVDLDRRALSEWCVHRLGGGEPVQVMFEVGHLSQVVGLRMNAGRSVVVKVRPWQDRLLGCGRVQELVAAAGYPAPRLVVAPERLGGFGISAETLVSGGELLPLGHDSADRFADALARLIGCAPEPSAVGGLAPSPAWVGWDHVDGRLWPDPDDREGDLNRSGGHTWLDAVGGAARAQLQSLGRPEVIGHCDWYSQNLRWIGRQLHVVHDWDSAVAQPEAAIVGQAAAIWPGTGMPGEVATVRQSERFLEAYQRASGRSWTDEEIAATWAAGLWTRAFDAKKACLAGSDPSVALSQAEAGDRSRLAGL
jgi:hypothetical protein